LGFINEQIDWKQRFFVPTDEEKGIVVLASLLARYPTIPREQSGEFEITSIESQELSRAQIVNLDGWFVPVTEAIPVSSLPPDDIKNTEPVSALSALHLAEATAPTQHITQTQLALNFG
jgi:hypothetical protein